MVEPAVAQVSVNLAYAVKGSAPPRRQRVPRARTGLNVPRAAAMMVCVNAHHANTIPPHVPGVAHCPLPVFQSLMINFTTSKTTKWITTATVVSEGEW